MMFQDIPPELQNTIIMSLDPISLISLSQTSRYWREHISPQKRHFVERLLAMELLPQYFNPRPAYLIRWACSSCLRLLPRASFENPYIGTIRYGKPPPDSPAACKLTSWTPTISPRTLWGRRYYNTPERILQRKNKKNASEQYVVAIWKGHGNRSPSLGGLHEYTVYELQQLGYKEFNGLSQEDYENMSYTDKSTIFNEGKRWLAGRITGYKRHKRRCMECRFQRGELRIAHGDCTRGTDIVPFIIGSKMRYVHALERLFPNLSKELKSEEPQLRDTMLFLHMFSEEHHGHGWVLRMMRCPQCGQWSEARTFRLAGLQAAWHLHILDDGMDDGSWGSRVIATDRLNASTCNGCFAKGHGIDALGQELLQIFVRAVNHQLARVQEKLMEGPERVEQLRTQASENSIVHKLAKLWQSISHGANPCSSNGLTDELVAKLPQYREELLQAREALVAEGHCKKRYDVLDFWNLHYNGVERQWNWLKAIRLEVEAKPEILVKWALSNDRKLQE